MIRELSTAVLLVGAMFATELRTNVASDTYSKMDNRPMISYLSNRQGLGLGGNLALSGMGSIDLHYTETLTVNRWRFSLSPYIGGSYADHVRELPQTVQFSLGMQGLVSYDAVTVGLNYWHLSNGDALGLAVSDKQNIGLDVLALQLGITF